MSQHHPREIVSRCVAVLTKARASGDDDAILAAMVLLLASIEPEQWFKNFGPKTPKRTKNESWFPPAPEPLTTWETAGHIIDQLRHAYIHDPWAPTWLVRNAWYLERSPFTSEQRGLRVNFRDLNGKPVDLAVVGGIDGVVGLAMEFSTAS